MEDQITPYNNSTVKNLMEKSISGTLKLVGSRQSISHRSEKDREAVAAAFLQTKTSKHSASDLVNFMDDYEPQRPDLDITRAMVLA